MIVARIKRLKDEKVFEKTCVTLKEAKAWVASVQEKGKSEEIVVSPTKLKDATIIDESEIGGIKLFKQVIPAEYEVEYIESHLYKRQEQIDDLRKKRNKLLKCSDWLFLPDVKIDSKARKAYMDYRQYLRQYFNVLRSEDKLGFEAFESYLRRTYPEEFQEGGKGDRYVKMFYSNLE